MEMLSNGYGCIRKRSKTLKQSLFDWMLHKFNSLLISTMSDIPTASTSTASTSSASTSQTNPYSFRLGNQDIDCTTTDDSEISSDDDVEIPDEESSNNSNEIECMCDESDDNMDDTSWSSIGSSNVSCGDKSVSDNSETENTKIKNMITESSVDKSTSDENLDDSATSTTPILILVQMNEIGIDLINVEEHAKRLRELEKELDFIETTEWMYRPIDSCIR